MTRKFIKVADRMTSTAKTCPAVAGTRGARALLLALIVSATACMPGVRLDTFGAKEADVTGEYRVILHGCNYHNDLNTIAFLQKEGTGFTFDMYAPDFNYRVVKGLTAKEALSKAEKFLDCSTSFRTGQLRKIVTSSGEVLGYEVKPLYDFYTYGTDEPLQTDYRMQKGTVQIKIWLDPTVERMLQGGADRDPQ